MTLKEFGLLIKKKRVDSRLSQRALGLLIWPSRDSQLSQSRISVLERGLTCTRSTLKVVCEYFNIDVPNIEIGTTVQKERKSIEDRVFLDFYMLRDKDKELISNNQCLRDRLSNDVLKLVEEQCDSLRSFFGIVDTSE